VSRPQPEFVLSTQIRRWAAQEAVAGRLLPWLAAFGTGPLLLATAGLLLIGLLKTPLRWSGTLLLLLAVALAARKPAPDVLVADDGRAFAVRGAGGRLAFHHSGGDTFAIHEWLAGDADGRDVHDRGLGEGMACDTSGCIGKLADGALVAYVTAPDAFEEDCARAILIVTAHEPPPGCAAAVIGRKLWRRQGALALRRSGSGFVIASARSANFDRPWSPAPQHARLAVATETGADISAPSRSAPRDATPRQDDIEADQ